MACLKSVAFATLFGWATATSAFSKCDVIPVSGPPTSAQSAGFGTAVKAPGTALLTSESPQAYEAPTLDAQATLLLKSYEQHLVPIAMIKTSSGKRPRRVTWYGGTGQSSGFTAAIGLSTMEHLYAFLLRQSPEDKFQFMRETKGSSFGGSLLHPTALEGVAKMRTCFAAELLKLDPAAKITQWRIATIRPFPSKKAQGLEVSALVKGEAGEPVAGQLTFFKGAHLGCSATAQPDGSASCTLFDLHDHEIHDHEHSVTVVTYSGFIGPKSIVLPTTRAEGRNRGHSSD